MLELNEEKAQKLKEQYGNVAYVEATNGYLFFRRPTRVEYERYQDKYASDSTKVRTHLKELAVACLVEPDLAGFEAALNAEPTMLMSDVSPLLHDLAGDGREKRKGKL